MMHVWNVCAGIRYGRPFVDIDTCVSAMTTARCLHETECGRGQGKGKNRDWIRVGAGYGRQQL